MTHFEWLVIKHLQLIVILIAASVTKHIDNDSNDQLATEIEALSIESDKFLNQNW